MTGSRSSGTRPSPRSGCPAELSADRPSPTTPRACNSPRGQPCYWERARPPGPFPAVCPRSQPLPAAGSRFRAACSASGNGNPQDLPLPQCSQNHIPGWVRSGCDLVDWSWIWGERCLAAITTHTLLQVLLPFIAEPERNHSGSDEPAWPAPRSLRLHCHWPVAASAAFSPPVPARGQKPWRGETAPPAACPHRPAHD